MAGSDGGTEEGATGGEKSGGGPEDGHGGLGRIKPRAILYKAN